MTAKGVGERQCANARSASRTVASQTQQASCELMSCKDVDKFTVAPTGHWPSFFSHVS